jgi:hypothetical protein
VPRRGLSQESAKHTKSPKKINITCETDPEHDWWYHERFLVPEQNICPIYLVILVSRQVDGRKFRLVTKRASLNRNCRVDRTKYVIDQGLQIRMLDVSGVPAGASTKVASSITASERYAANVTMNIVTV